jgi:phosphoglycolate phosphatase
MSTVVNAPAVPGAVTAMRRLAAAGYTLTAVSGLSSEVVRSFFVLHDLGVPIRRIAARAGASTPVPPDPHLLRQAIQALGANPQQCVLVAGSVNDVKAAAAADVRAIAYSSTGAAASQFVKHGATMVIQDLAEVADAGAAEFAWKP